MSTPALESIDQDFKECIIGDDYILGKTIGEGTFGKVKLGIHLLTNEEVAVKILEKEKLVEKEDLVHVWREIKILKQIEHNHITQLYDIIEEKQAIYLIMEYNNNGELFDYIVKETRLSETTACKFMHQLINGVEFLHKNGIAHRDLKPENLLLDSNMNIKIVDFGLSNLYEKNELLSTACGSPCYAAPEMVAGEQYNPLCADIWSCGVILFAMLCGYLPFENSNTEILYSTIMKGEYEIPDFINPEARDLITSILNINPKERYTIEQIRAHSWWQLTKDDQIMEDISAEVNATKKEEIKENIMKKLQNLQIPLNEIEEALNSENFNTIKAALIYNSFYYFFCKDIKFIYKIILNIFIN